MELGLNTKASIIVTKVVTGTGPTLDKALDNFIQEAHEYAGSFRVDSGDMCNCDGCK